MITCAAIKTLYGEIITGKRHPDCIKKMAGSGKYSLPVTQDAIQGFIDDKENFLDRMQARQHFIDCGQISKCGKLHPTQLFSEDLY
jgi:hypothetical protein